MQQVPVMLGALAAELGITVKLSSLPTGISGQIERADAGYEIKINRHETRERQRFTLAHEIAHFLLHREYIDAAEGGIKDNVLYRSGAPHRIEFEANRLAADLVMPPFKIDEELSRFEGELSESEIEVLARRFGVSKAAMEIRISGR
jgi:Zn-dependent peptidase ImmA (M78 family)